MCPHAGPTNSGKTYNAVQALKGAQTGLYCSPLRLLALEQYDRLNQVRHVCMGSMGSGTQVRHAYTGSTAAEHRYGMHAQPQRQIVGMF